ncbi:Origin of replication complex subunit 6 [Mycoemilia scoparia]|uniref:Origin of replication complex subunit 6 n=1 Tax=Mycoemilia scoparia TaxID=417184 RepID=A0A9W7ZZC9_9FUNG|nr:Origin of replication complex subunit 6 [Mycoemilia scoparia]
MDIPFNETAAIQLSAVGEKVYQSCVKEFRMLLGIQKELTIQELTVQFGCPPEVTYFTQAILKDFKKNYSFNLPPAYAKNNIWESPINIVAAFYLAAGCIKKGLASKSKLSESTKIPSTKLNDNIKQFEKYCGAALTSIKVQAQQAGLTKNSNLTPKANKSVKAKAKANSTSSPVTQLINAYEKKAMEATSSPFSTPAKPDIGAASSVRKRKLDSSSEDEQKQNGNENSRNVPTKRIRGMSGSVKVSPSPNNSNNSTGSMSGSVKVSPSPNNSNNSTGSMSALAKRVARIGGPNGHDIRQRINCGIKAKTSPTNPHSSTTASAGSNSLSQGIQSSQIKRNDSIRSMVNPSGGPIIVNGVSRLSTLSNRIGIAPMIQDRDYRKTKAYANYQAWKKKQLDSE